MLDEETLIMTFGEKQLVISLEEAWASCALGALWAVSRCLVEIAEELHGGQPNCRKIGEDLARIQSVANAALMELDQGSFLDVPAALVQSHSSF